MRHLLIAFVGLMVFSLFLSCQKEVSVEFGSPAKGSLQSSAGDCLPKLVAGSYISSKALNDSNFMEVTVNVAAPGPYNIYTDTISGYSFRSTGSFTNTGSQVVRLKGSGTPSASGVHIFTVTAFDTSYCDISVTVLPAGTTPGPAAFTLVGAPGGCTNFGLNGTYYKDSTLDQRHFVLVDVNVTAIGTYTISTAPVNGYSFTGTGTFAAPGANRIRLNATGKPLATGANTFTVTAGSSSCTFPVSVTTPTTNPPPPAGCNPNVQGTFTAGTATTSANTVTLTHTYATAGTYNVTVPAVNGITFGTQAVVATIPGPNTITLTASGTPTTAGTNNFTVNFGDGQNCTFPVTVNPATPPPVNNDYFPLTANSWWSYDAGGGDTLKITNTGSTTVTGSSNTYQRFVTTFQNSPIDTSFYRRDAAADFYYQSLDTAGWGSGGLRFSQARLDVRFLKNALATGDSIVTDFNATLATQGNLPVILRFKYKVVSANATLTIGTRTFTNVYHLQDYIEFGVMGNFIDSGEAPWDYYYVRGVGLIRFKAGTYDQRIRFWQVN